MAYLSRNKQALLLALFIHFVLGGGIAACWIDLSKKIRMNHEPVMVISLNRISPPFQNQLFISAPQKNVYSTSDKDIQSRSRSNKTHSSQHQLPNTDVSLQKDTGSIIPTKTVEALIRRHYGELFEDLSTEEKKYIIENIITIHRIDRKIGNALLADKPRSTFYDGESNYVEMYLHPDGTVSDITIIDEGEHPALDEVTRETVERSYSSYPLPKQTTLIRLHTKIFKAK